MLGLYTVIRENNRTNSSNIHYIINNSTIKSGYSLDSKSPIWYFNYEDYLIIIEGVIYNFNQEEIKEAIIEVIKSDNRTNGFFYFQDREDGEFIIQIANLKSENGYIISDKYARLPFYYSLLDDVIIFSRNINEMLSDLLKISFSFQAFYEFMSFEFILGNKTFINEVKRLEPFEIISFNYDKRVDLQVIQRKEK